MSRLLLALAVLLLVPSCLPLVAVNVVADGLVDDATIDGPRCGVDTVCISTSAARELDRARAAEQRPVIERGRALTAAAVAAARSGDCATVVAIRHEVLALPDVDLVGGVHDAIFLREPAVLDCLAAQRDRG